MKFGIKTLDDINVSGKTVICRVDINQPVDKKTGKLNSTARIEACIPTLEELAEKKAKVVVLAHQGSDIEYKNFYTLAPHRDVLAEKMGRDIIFIDDVTGPAARAAIAELKPGEILLLDNVRFASEEQTLFENHLHLSHEEQAKTQVVSKLAPLADFYVCDAFAASHRDQPSLCGFQQVLPSAMGRLFETEYEVLSELMTSPKHPSVFVLGGAKVQDAFLMMGTVLENGSADEILTGGLAANIVLAAMGKPIGSGSMEYIKSNGFEPFIETAAKLVEKYGNRIVVPTDLAWLEDGKRRDGKLSEIPEDATCLDIGEETAKIYQEKILNAATVFVNGPMGVFEDAETELGTKAVWEALGETSANTVLGGGDSITATTKYRKTDKISYICTGGGAMIRFLSGKEMPVVTALKHGAEIAEI